jgi:hypothetical protein
MNWLPRSIPVNANAKGLSYLRDLLDRYSTLLPPLTFLFARWWAGRSTTKGALS